MICHSPIFDDYYDLDHMKREIEKLSQDQLKDKIKLIKTRIKDLESQQMGDNDWELIHYRTLQQQFQKYL